MFDREDFEQAFSKARTIADIIRALSQAEMETDGKPSASLYNFLADDLDSRFERIQVEIEDWDRREAAAASAAVPPPLPPLTERETRLNDEITTGLREATVKLRKRNLDRAVQLAQQAADGRGPLVDHFCELGRRFDDLQAEGDAS